MPAVVLTMLLSDVTSQTGRAVMTSSVDFSYRLPLTFVRVTGTRTRTIDIENKTALVCKAAVTTELAADMLTKLDVSMSAEAMAKQKSIWKFTSDGRLTGADVTTTVEPLAGLSTALKAGATVLGVAGPALLAAGPPGWIALAAAVGATSLVAGAAVNNGFGALVEIGDTAVDAGEPKGLQDADLDEWKVHPRYREKDADEAKALANLRCALVTAERNYARAALAAAQATSASDQLSWDMRLNQLQRLLASVSAGAARAEARYANWVAAETKTTTESHDHRFRIDQMPTEETLTFWAEQPDRRSSRGPWVDSVETLQTAVSVDLEEINGDNGVERLTNFKGSGDHQVYYRPPRPAVVKVWEATPTETDAGVRYALKLVELRRLQVSSPGNEAAILIEAGDRASSAVAVTFDETGALSGVTAEVTDPRLQRANDVSSVLDTVTGAVSTGKDLREALAPPSLVDQAAEAKAAAELGLVKSDPDPLKALKAQVAEQQLRAQLALAQQLQTANSVPVFVAVTQVSD